MQIRNHFIIYKDRTGQGLARPYLEIGTQQGRRKEGADRKLTYCSRSKSSRSPRHSAHRQLGNGGLRPLVP